MKEELLNAVWADTFVQESNLTQNIFVLRKALGDADGDGEARRRYIVTVPGRGYRFVEKVRTVAEPEPPVAQELLPAAAAESPSAISPRVPARRRVLVSVLAVLTVLVIALAVFAYLHNRRRPISWPATILWCSPSSPT